MMRDVIEETYFVELGGINRRAFSLHKDGSCKAGVASHYQGWELQLGAEHDAMEEFGKRLSLLHVLEPLEMKREHVGNSLEMHSFLGILSTFRMESCQAGLPVSFGICHKRTCRSQRVSL